MKKDTEKGCHTRTEQADQKHVADIKNFQPGRIRHLKFPKRFRIILPHPDIGKAERIAAICPFIFQRVQQHPNNGINERYAINSQYCKANPFTYSSNNIYFRFRHTLRLHRVMAVEQFFYSEHERCGDERDDDTARRKDRVNDLAVCDL